MMGNVFGEVFLDGGHDVFLGVFGTDDPEPTDSGPRPYRPGQHRSTDHRPTRAPSSPDALRSRPESSPARRRRHEPFTA